MAKKQADHSEKAQEGSKATPSKTEAVKEAIAQGITSPTEIVAHVKSTYGLVVTTNHVSMIKTALKKGTTGRKRGRPKGKTKKPVPEASATGPDTATPSKSEAVREAMSKGITSPTAIAAHLKAAYGLDITTAHVSTIKGNLKKRKGTKRGRPKGSTKKAIAEAAAAAAAAVVAKAIPAPKAGGLTLNDLRTLNEMARKAGGYGQLREFLDVLGDL